MAKLKSIIFLVNLGALSIIFVVNFFCNYQPTAAHYSGKHYSLLVRGQDQGKADETMKVRAL